MKAGWEYVDLSAAVDKQSSNISRKKIADQTGDFPVYGAKGFEKTISYFQQENEYLAIIKDGAGVGRLSKYPAKSSVLATLQYLIPRDGFHIDFVKYFLLSVDFEKYRVGSTIPHIYWKHYKVEKIPALPIAEQKQIVSVLDQAFAGIERAAEAARKNRDNARELFKTTLNATFTQKGEGWVEATLGEVCDDFGRGKSKHRPRNEPSLYGGVMPFIQTGDLSRADHYIRSFEKTYSDLGIKQSKVWPAGTVCVAIVGATIGESGILSFEACFPDSVIGMVPASDKANSEFIEFLLQFFKAELKEAGKGSARDNINLKTFSDRKFSFPSLARQKDEVEKLNLVAESVAALEAIYQQKLDALEELKQSLLQKAFAGELTADFNAAEAEADLVS
jgi:type I restriction enzyme S subunit